MARYKFYIVLYCIVLYSHRAGALSQDSTEGLPSPDHLVVPYKRNLVNFWLDFCRLFNFCYNNEDSANFVGRQCRHS